MGTNGEVRELLRRPEQPTPGAEGLVSHCVDGKTVQTQGLSQDLLSCHQWWVSSQSQERSLPPKAGPAPKSLVPAGLLRTQKGGLPGGRGSHGA